MDIIITMIKLYKKIAELHKPELQSTQDTPNWNSSYTQMLKLKKMIDDNTDAAQVQSKGLNLLNGTFAEVQSEIPTLVSNDHLDTALTLYKEIKTNLTTLVNTYQPFSAK